jgi:hypothetical protein
VALVATGRFGIGISLMIVLSARDRDKTAEARLGSRRRSTEGALAATQRAVYRHQVQALRVV